MHNNPYIGITGFTEREEVDAALASFSPLPRHKLMIGVISTWKSIHNIPTKPYWSKRIPSPNAIKTIFPDDDRVINLIHFSTEDDHVETMLSDLLMLHTLAGPNLHGFQLNIVWPPLEAIHNYRKKAGRTPRLVLQLSRAAIEFAGGTIEKAVEMLRSYEHIIDDVLFDMSAGKGSMININQAFTFLRLATEQDLHMNFGVAGGLGPTTIGILYSLAAEFPRVCIDAEGRLRTANNDLDLEAINAYLKRASQIFK